MVFKPNGQRDLGDGAAGGFGLFEKIDRAAQAPVHQKPRKTGAATG